jgi:hypothetical protein
MSNEIFVCPDCGSEDVLQTSWVYPYSVQKYMGQFWGILADRPDGAKDFCRDCGEIESIVAEGIGG